MNATRDRGEEFSWQGGLAALRRYLQLKGTAEVSARARADGFPLGEWAAQLRARYWAGTLDPERVELLEQMPGWHWNGADQRKWHFRFNTLRRYIKAHGTAAVLPSDAVVGKIPLGQWATAQRARYQAGTLPKPNAERLEYLPGWQWSVDETAQPLGRWTAVLDALKTYVLTTGDSNPPCATTVNGFPLGQWVRRLRQEFHSGTLPSAVAAEAEALSRWSWDPSRDNWEAGLHALRRWLVSHADANPPQSSVLDGFPIGSWVHRRRRQYRAGTLPADRCSELEALPGWRWNVPDAAWDRAMQTLQDFTAMQGTARVPYNCVAGDFRLGSWVQRQRMLHNRGSLDPKRAAQLEALPGWSWGRKR